MAIYSKISNVVVEEFYSNVPGFNSTNLTKTQQGVATTTETDPGDGGWVYNFDDVDTTPSWTAIQIGSWSLSDVGAGSGGGDTQLNGAPWGAILNRDLQPGEILTISGYPYRGKDPSSSDNIPTSQGARFRVFYENRPGEIKNFKTFNRSSFHGGVDNSGVPKSNGHNVGVISPWEWSPGEDYNGYMSAEGYNDSDSFSENSDLVMTNLPTVHSMSTSGFPKHFRIKIANDSQTSTAIKLSAVDPITNESDKWLGWYKLKFKIEKSPRILEGATITSVGDINFRNIPTGFWHGTSSHTRAPQTTVDFLETDDVTHKYTFLLRPLNCWNGYPGKVVMPLGGGESAQDHTSGFYIDSANNLNFNSSTVGSAITGTLAGGTWTHSVGATTSSKGYDNPVILQNDAGTNRVYGLVGDGQAAGSVENPPHADFPGKWRWIKYTLPNATLSAGVRIKYKVYEAPPPSGQSYSQDYGLTNDPELSESEHLYFQYKIGSGSWVTARTHTAEGYSGAGHDLSTEFSTLLYDRDLNWGSNDLAFRWISFHKNDDCDYWAIDDVKRERYTNLWVPLVSYKPLVAPSLGHVARIDLKFENPDSYTGAVYAKLYRVNPARKPHQNINVDSSSDLTLLWTATGNQTSISETVAASTTNVFSKNDTLVMILEPADLSARLGTVHGLCMLRFQNADLREVT